MIEPQNRPEREGVIGSEPVKPIEAFRELAEIVS